MTEVDFRLDWSQKNMSRIKCSLQDSTKRSSKLSAQKLEEKKKSGASKVKNSRRKVGSSKKLNQLAYITKGVNTDVLNYKMLLATEYETIRKREEANKLKDEQAEKNKENEHIKEE